MRLVNPAAGSGQFIEDEELDEEDVGTLLELLDDELLLVDVELELGTLLELLLDSEDEEELGGVEELLLDEAGTLLEEELTDELELSGG